MTNGYSHKNQNGRGNDFEKAPIYDFNRLQNGYTDEKGDIKEQFMLGDAERLAAYIAGDKRLDRYGNTHYSGIKSSQLRNFYGEVKALQSKMGKKGEEFHKVYPFVLMLKSKAAYKESQNNIPESFKNFIDINVELIKNANKDGKGFEAFNNFALFFEVVIGFFKGATK
ncbi:type III-A CRISPR-associated protein Csm2 [uncultured Ilyobacter sp.]|uniref:type III-A CRISPR-associated protein Csm2 n=1 Tax=uncultured Ilyobacter sp. TaxID=544433 RepID=UPI0029C78B37|nr:type III-A CRISPR-associated protein Csm2 [uncultured Ilyobacter sp.]